MAEEHPPRHGTPAEAGSAVKTGQTGGQDRFRRVVVGVGSEGGSIDVHRSDALSETSS